MKEVTKNQFCTYYDPLSVTLRYTSLDEEQLIREAVRSWNSNWNHASTVRGEGFETYLVQGSPYITIQYTRSTPIITALSIFCSFHCLLKDDGEGNDGSGCSSSSSSTAKNFF